MRQLKENFPTFFPQSFHNFSTIRKPLWTKILDSFPHGLVFPFLVFHVMWIYTSLTFMLFCLDKGVHYIHLITARSYFLSNNDFCVEIGLVSHGTVIRLLLATMGS